jgi:peptide/nickel transport system substrate-binding protein
VLDQLPTLENGGAEIRKADVFLDAAGNITTTTTTVITQVDQLVVTYRWNPELKWSDGTPVTAVDSVFAYEQAKANPPNDEARDKLAQTIEYTAVDEHTTRAVLRPDFTGPTYFLSYWTPLPRHILANADEMGAGAFAEQPIGYGPYMIEQQADGVLRMVRNPHFFGPAPVNSRLDIVFMTNLDVLRANMLNGNLDVVATERVQSEDMDAIDKEAASGGINASYITTPIWEHIDFNLDISTLQNFRVRRAIAFGSNRQQMVDSLFRGHTPVLHSWVLPNQPEAAPQDQINRYEYNPDQARQLLEEAGYSDPDGDGIRASPDGVTLTLQLLTTADSPIRKQVADQFVQDMQAIGITIEVSEVDSNTLFAADGPLRQRQFELALYGWKAEPTAGGLSLWNCNSVPQIDNNWTGENFAGWCFRDADIAIRKAATTLDLNERKTLYLKQQQLWTQELPAIPLFQRVGLVLIAPKVQGPQPDTFAPITWNIASWQRS